MCGRAAAGGGGCSMRAAWGGVGARRPLRWQRSLRALRASRSPPPQARGCGGRGCGGRGGGGRGGRVKLGGPDDWRGWWWRPLRRRSFSRWGTGHSTYRRPHWAAGWGTRRRGGSWGGGKRCDVKRVDLETLTMSEFERFYHQPRKPVILTCPSGAECWAPRGTPSCGVPLLPPGCQVGQNKPCMQRDEAPGLSQVRLRFCFPTRRPARLPSSL
jgi:hypothetical protein